MSWVVTQSGPERGNGVESALLHLIQTNDVLGPAADEDKRAGRRVTVPKARRVAVYY